MLKKALTTTALATVLLTSSISAGNLIDGVIFENEGYNIGVIYPSQYQNVIMTIDDLAGSGPESKWRWNNYNLEIFTSGSKKLCLNAHNPRRGSNVNLFRCTQSDPEQHWQWIKNGYQKGMIKLIGTNYCLNAHNINQGTNVNLWTCDKDDTDQQFNYLKPLKIFNEWNGED